MELEELAKKAKERRKKSNGVVMDKYHYARNLGFSSAEAVVLMGTSKENITEMARKRDAANNDTPKFNA